MARRGRSTPSPVERLHRARGRDPGRPRDVLRLHQGHPVHERLPGQGAVRVGQLDPAQLAGPDRGRRGRQGQGRRGSGGLQRRRAGAGARRRRAAAARGRDGQDPPAHLPRGQLLRGPQARHAERSRARLGRHDQGHADGHAGAARRSADLAAERLARGPAGRARGPQHGAELRADGRGGRGVLAAGARADRRGVLQRRARRHPRRRALDRAGARGAARHRARPRRRAADPRHGEHRRRARPLRERAQGPDHQPQHHDGGVRVGVGQPAGLDPRAGADAAQRQRRLRLTQRGLPVDARVRHRDPPGRARDAGHDRGRVPVDRPDARARRPRRARRAGRGARARERGPRAPRRPRDRAAPADRPRLQVPARRRAAERRHRHRRRVPVRRGELQGVLLRAGRHRRRGPELRRQRHVRALPDRRRLAVGLARQPEREHRPAVRQQPGGPARQPPGLSRQAAAVQALRALPQAADPRRQRPGGGEVAADRRAGATAQVSTLRDKLRKEADLNAVRKKLDPFGTQEQEQEKAK